MSKLRAPKIFSDFVALYIAKTFRFSAKKVFAKYFIYYLLFLETFARSSSAAASQWIHLKCLQKVKYDRDWIKILTNQAENERIHLITIIEIIQPKLFVRLLIIFGQITYQILYLFLYIIFPRTAHRFIGYSREESARDYNNYLEHLENDVSLNINASQISIKHWNLDSKAKLIDVVKLISKDKMNHATINHKVADTIDEDKNNTKNLKQIAFNKKEPNFDANSSQSNLNLYSPTKIGDISLFNKIVMAPLTRSRANLSGVPSPMMMKYYSQRASAGLIIAEATQISQQGQGYALTPGIYTEEQTNRWMDIVADIHKKGGKICLQLCHAGRISHIDLQPDNQVPVAPSAKIAEASTWLESGSEKVSEPKELQAFEIVNIIEDFRQAAFNAKKAGFDMVEIHAANGYLIDQFIRNSTNIRSDNYGGTIENRTRFLLEIVDAIASIYSPNKIGCRVSPLSTFNDIIDSEPQPLFEHIAIELGKKGLGYLHAIEGGKNDKSFDYIKFYTLFKDNGGLSCMVNNGYDKHLKNSSLVDLVVYGIPFIANPDLVYRLEHDLPLSEADSSTFYGGGEKGYTDYPFYESSESNLDKTK